MALLNGGGGPSGATQVFHSCLVGVGGGGGNVLFFILSGRGEGDFYVGRKNKPVENSKLIRSACSRRQLLPSVFLLFQKHYTASSIDRVK